MGYRLSKIYTRTGDDGTTGLANGERIAKSAERVEALGSVDELNSALGVLRSEPGLPAEIDGPLARIQNELFEIGAELALPGARRVAGAAVAQLERDLDALNADLPPLVEFVLPGGERRAALCHFARSIARRAERRAWSLAQTADVNPELTRYLNRLSDLLFVMGRSLARRYGVESTWQRGS